MKRNWRTYVLLIAVALISLAGAIILPLPELSKNLIASPFALSLIAAIYQILMDESRFVKEKSLKEEERLHALSISSHMAIVAFNKHAEFSEKYLDAMRKGIVSLVAKGPCKEALDLAIRLKDIRLDYAAWVTRDTRESLFPFEHALTMIGGNRELASDMPPGNDRKAALHTAHALFMRVMEYEKDTPEKEISVSKVVETIQGLLGINELTELRKKAIAEASKAPKNTA